MGVLRRQDTGRGTKVPARTPRTADTARKVDTPPAVVNPDTPGGMGKSGPIPSASPFSMRPRLAFAATPTAAWCPRLRMAMRTALTLALLLIVTPALLAQRPLITTVPEE